MDKKLSIIGQKLLRISAAAYECGISVLVFKLHDEPVSDK